MPFVANRKLGSRPPLSECNLRCFSPDERILALGGKPGQIQLCETESGREIGVLPAAVCGRAWPQCFSPDGTRLYAKVEGDTGFHVLSFAGGFATACGNWDWTRGGPNSLRGNSMTMHRRQSWRWSKNFPRSIRRLVRAFGSLHLRNRTADFGDESDDKPLFQPGEIPPWPESLSRAVPNSLCSPSSAYDSAAKSLRRNPQHLRVGFGDVRRSGPWQRRCWRSKSRGGRRPGRASRTHQASTGPLHSNQESQRRVGALKQFAERHGRGSALGGNRP